MPRCSFLPPLLAWSSMVLLACTGSGPVPPLHPRQSVAAPVPTSDEQPAKPNAAKLWAKAEAVFEMRCVVCHGCYDAPCQLKLDTFEGIARGASPQKVYDASRLTAADPTRLFIDAHTPEAWQKKGFHPVIAEAASARASALVRMLELKRAHPLLPGMDIDQEFTLDLNREETCTLAEDFDAFGKAHPLWGMPYALPALSDDEHAALLAWAAAGAPHPDEAALAKPLEQAIERWEGFFNEPSPKHQLAARYIYEHLFLGSLYFEDIAGHDSNVSFRLVRSRTPTGTQVDEIPSRRPFDDPGPGAFYYRLVRRYGQPLAKTHMPYALSAARLQRYHELFIEPDYAVGQLPSYAPELASNPFRAFRELPAASRYRFMLDEAEFTMMGFIKGPVCRGQVALNVIQERFWVTFIDPDSEWIAAEARLLASDADSLSLPAEEGSNDLPTRWYRYARKHASYVDKKSQLLHQLAKHGHAPDLESIWQGGGKNQNAALTIFRHFDSASVVKGLVGGAPKTAWVVSYALLERIHYSLVAGFDVFGNMGHQVNTRLYMDFLRMEGEANFLTLLPLARRRPLIDAWYRGAERDLKTRLYRELTSFADIPKIRYQTRTPERELYAMLEARLQPVRSHVHDLERIEDAELRQALQRLAASTGPAASWLPEISFLAVEDSAGDASYFTVLRDSAHTNVAQIFGESNRRIPSEDGLTVTPGLLGAYPNVLFAVARKDLELFVDAVVALNGKPAYTALRASFGVLRASERFWPFSDRMQNANRHLRPLESGLLDYNRLEAF